MGETARDGARAVYSWHASTHRTHRRLRLLKLSQETLYVGVDIGKQGHVSGFLSTTLLARHRRFEHCPTLSFENSREEFHALTQRIQAFVPLTQVQVLLEVTGHYHRALMQYLQDLGIPVYIIHVQKRPEGLLKTDKRNALNLANMLYNQLEKGIQGSRASPGGSSATRDGPASCRTRPGEYTTQKQADRDL